MKNPVLRTSNGLREALENLWYGSECSVTHIEDAVEDSTTGYELMTKLNSLHLFRKFTLDRETDTKVRLKSVDRLGNVSYFEVTKEPKAQKEKQLATHITNEINCIFDYKAFVEQMSCEHKTLQSDFTTLCLEWLLKCREMYEEDRYDGRNEHACRTGKVLMDYLDNGKF